MCKNYYLFKKFSFLYKYYCFIDSKQYDEEDIFERKGVETINYIGYASKVSTYAIYFVLVKKKHEKQFLEAMEELKKKLLLLDYKDYPEACKRFTEEMYRDTGEKLKPPKTKLFYI